VMLEVEEGLDLGMVGLGLDVGVLEMGFNVGMVEVGLIVGEDGVGAGPECGDGGGGVDYATAEGDDW